MSNPVAIVWLRRDLRLSDHPALTAAAQDGALMPLFILDEQMEALGAAPRWRLEQSLKSLAADLEARGLKLILRRGDPRAILTALAQDIGAVSVHWSRLYDGGSVARDTEVKSALKEAGVSAVSHAGHVLHEPWTVETKTGGFYKVYTPYWKAVRGADVPEPIGIPDLRAPDTWPESDALEAWQLSADMDRGGAIVATHETAGEDTARGVLGGFIGSKVEDYGTARDKLFVAGTSTLSAHFAWGELSIRTAWHAAKRKFDETGSADVETFMKELVWRDFAWHLIYHTPQIETENWRPEWDGFPWRGDNEDAERWRRGLTGEPIVDAGMREMYVTGRMHNRVRMIVACYLTKHLQTDWRVGLKWFEECLVDHDPASNAMGWQWSAGSGPDATPYFRVFNPETQAEKFDPKGIYRRKWLDSENSAEAASYFKAVPRSWGLSAAEGRPPRMIDLKDGRQRALDAYQEFKAQGQTA
ncbi:cryptochrome/photolyase family protein [Pontivivens insulae]|uniref:Deoxyribodipyrimidine photo-lyase n=1 Tax=Pontivivens insulae TaxID=1639689 RepID=A0A2R8ADB4_9RHOB|nr:deoxyribodipyrimidine photo-lyase [Pontivivens insulae]RED13991.1 deoxyribodipyrimidine photo-lyase type I [Pontivivens insulae]SPF30065.1 Deoxyribodipyrimidine photo-lyase [Pontivivens insulae]